MGETVDNCQAFRWGSQPFSYAPVKLEILFKQSSDEARGHGGGVGVGDLILIFS